MIFEKAFELMKSGESVALPEWGGYWAWDKEQKTIKMHCKDGCIVDIRNSPDMGFTLSHTFRDDWEIVDNEASTEHSINAGRT